MQGLNQQTTDGVPFVQTEVLLAGPHLDISGTCKYLDDQSLKKQIEPHHSKQLLNLSNLVKRMLVSPEKENRLAAAGEILKLESKCGLALAVMAREGAASASEADDYYRESIGSLCAELTSASKKKALKKGIEFGVIREPIGSFVITEETAVTVTVEFARRLKQRGELDEAMAFLNRAADLTEDPNAAMTELFAWHMCADQIADARVLLDRKAANDERWYFMHAFATYREHGEGAIARSAMHSACQNSQVHAHTLAGDDLEEIKDYAWSCFGPLPVDELIEFAAVMRPVIDGLPGLQQWLIDCACNSPSFANITKAVSSRPDIKPAEQSTRDRFKSLRINIDYMQAHQKRQEFKEVKKYLRLAFRDCRKLPLGTWEIYTALRIAALYEHLDLAEAVRDILKEQGTLAHESDDLRIRARVYTEIGTTLSLLKDCELSRWFLAHAGDALETLHKTNPEFDSYYELSAPLDELGLDLLKHDMWEPAEQLYFRIASIQSQYLPMRHPAVLVPIYLRAECMHKLGRHQDEGDLMEVVRELWPHEWSDEDEEAMPSCDVTESLN